LDPDVAARLREVVRARGVSFKEALNSAVRAGLTDAGPATAYAAPTRPMGLRPGVDIDHALRLAGELEDAETRHKLDLRK
jgi:hypothetical protein